MKLLEHDNVCGSFYGDHDTLIYNQDIAALARADFEKGTPANTDNETYLAIYGNCYAIAENQAHYTGDL